MSPAERVYRLLLLAYPSGFRTEYAQQMTLLFRDRRREVGAMRLSFWAAMAWDVVRSAPALRLEAARARWTTNIQMKGGKMKTMATLAILIGAIEVLNSLGEAWAGGIVHHGWPSLVGGAVGVLAGALLAASAIALLRRSPGATALATGAAITCLAVFALVALLRPMFSIFSTILGIGFPIVLLLFLRGARRKGNSVPMMT
jgi:hypothetical protein